MRYYYAVLAFAFGVSLMLSVAHADQKSAKSAAVSQTQKSEESRSHCTVKDRKKSPQRCAMSRRAPSR